MKAKELPFIGGFQSSWLAFPGLPLLPTSPFLQKRFDHIPNYLKKPLDLLVTRMLNREFTCSVNYQLYIEVWHPKKENANFLHRNDKITRKDITFCIAFNLLFYNVHFTAITTGGLDVPAWFLWGTFPELLPFNRQMALVRHTCRGTGLLADCSSRRKVLPGFSCLAADSHFG